MSDVFPDVTVDTSATATATAGAATATATAGAGIDQAVAGRRRSWYLYGWGAHAFPTTWVSDGIVSGSTKRTAVKLKLTSRKSISAKACWDALYRTNPG